MIDTLYVPVDGASWSLHVDPGVEWAQTDGLKRTVIDSGWHSQATGVCWRARTAIEAPGNTTRSVLFVFAENMLDEPA